MKTSINFKSSAQHRIELEALKSKDIDKETRKLKSSGDLFYRSSFQYG